MKVIQQIVPDRLINCLDDMVHRGKVKLNGQYVNYDIWKTVKDGNILRKYLYLETETGYVEEAQLLTSLNEIIAIKPFSIEKKDDGLVLAFEFELIIQEVGRDL